MANASLRFFNDRASTSPSNIYITNVKFYKVPNRYRGYRYDSETGLYYLQSRYYNPEWGRFINADGILGQTGQLLGHNLFAYCGNNPVNRKDPSGFMWRMANEDGGSYDSTPNPITLGTAAGGIDSGVGKFVEDYVKITPYENYRTMAGNHTVRRAYLRNIPKDKRLIASVIPKTPKGIFAKVNGKLGLLGTLSLAKSTYDNFNQYNRWEAAVRTGIDVATYAAGAFLGAAFLAGAPMLLAIAGGVAIGFVTSAAGEGLKNAIWKRE